MGLLGGLLGGGGSGSNGYKQKTISTLSPEQQQLFSLLFNGSKGGLGSGLEHLSKLASGDQEYAEQLEAPALRQFGALQGNISSRFSAGGGGPGALSSRKSSGFGNTMSSASQQLSESLQSQRLGMQNNAIEQLLGLSKSLLGTQTQETGFFEKGQSGWQKLLSSLAGGVGGGLGRSFLGGGF